MRDFSLNCRSSLAWLRWLPIIGWLPGYRWRTDGAADALAAILVTAMLIPQSLSYAMLAGMPVQTGLYASILPACAYAVFGSSRTLSVGPMAVTSLMSANIIYSAQQQLGLDAITAAGIYALMSGVFLLILGILRFGFIAQLISPPVMAGFNNASVLIIVWPQLWQLMDLPGVPGIANTAAHFHPWALGIGGTALAVLWLGKTRLPQWLRRWLSAQAAAQWSKTVPLWVMLAAGAVGFYGYLPESAVHTVGTVPQGLPRWHWPLPDWAALHFFALPSALMALVIYVNAIGVGQVLAARHNDVLQPNQELIGLGAANIASALQGAFPVTGGFSRSAVNDDAGARSQMAGIFTALLMAVSVLWLAPLFAALPTAVLAAMIVMSVASMLDWRIVTALWRFGRGEWAVMMVTFATALFWRVDIGIAVGMLASFTLLISRGAKPHMAEIGQLPGSESFRNVSHFGVTTWPAILSLRMDESLQFYNHRFCCEHVLQQARMRPGTRHVVLQCHAMNQVDYAGATALLRLNRDLHDHGMDLSLSEVKMPVQMQLDTLDIRNALNGRIYLTHHQAVAALLHADAGNTP